MTYTPDRNEIVFIDFEPVKGKEIGKYRPALVLSSKAYNSATGLLICCPISSSVRGGLLEVPINNIDKPYAVVANMIQTLSWRTRKAKFVAHAETGVMNQVYDRLLPIMGAQEYINSKVNEYD
ncbi:type II toxin-antitoxin system PemK/MazF family toxin [Pseudoalteromonas sp. Z1A8]|uniref:type II toxin-antitoxin system PemK/MazF family toxin n=1 Tax=Pseudoalteromonas sp. Z1A8 TaxID=2686354 RepID=UPI00140E5C24|nr:type II toxin-antitoxin system PemK/MazF family toxin [Pseudoalteromonas sp. Z1A8]